MKNLEKFIIKAKSNGWAQTESGGKQIPPSRLGSLDIIYEEGDFFYQDSFVGFSDFCGQEHVCFRGEPAWSMAYYGFLVRPEIFTTKQTTKILRAALSALYREERFLGAFHYQTEDYIYEDSNTGDYKRFHGAEKISFNNTLVYELKYFGGTVQK